jgi:hypothetical protein
VQHEIADVRSTPTGQALWPVPEARPCVTANLPDVRRNPHAPPSVTLLARSRWKRAPSQYYAAGSEPSRVLTTRGVDQSRAAIPRLRLYRSLPWSRVISQRHAFVCSSLKIFAAQCWEQRGTRLWYPHWPAWNLGLAAEHLEGFGRECFPYPANLMIRGELICDRT